MVKLAALGYNLNHLIGMDTLPNEEIVIGDKQDVNSITHVFFDRSLALASDLKRLPILRSINFSNSFDAAIILNMVASGIATLRYVYRLFNDENDFSTFNRMAEMTGIISVGANGLTVLTIDQDDKSIAFKGGILLNPTIGAQLIVNVDAAVAGVALPTQSVNIHTDLEVDWVAVSKTEFEQYILESIYAES